MKRPLSVTILLWLVLSLTIWSALRLYTAIRWWNTIDEFATPPGPVYIALSAGVWLIVSLALLFGIWHAKNWIRYALLGAAIAVTIWYWGDRLLLQMPNRNWPFALVVSILVLITVSVCVFVPGTKTYFSEGVAYE